jgi:polysaccharide deacetylase family protein (PEP-CTERM system associated)
MTVDVEDWFQVENFKDHINFAEWHRLPSRVRQNTIKILDLFNSQPIPIKATFYILGWVAENYPDLVREIFYRGHEVASHGYSHSMCTGMGEEALLEDLIRSKEVLEKITGTEVIGYRAPSFSINDATLSVIQKAGYRYDSSYNSFTRHGRYGAITTNGLTRNGIAYKVGPSFHELPVSNLQINGQILPWAGGGYFRLLPFILFKKGVREILSRQGTYVFYMHPWEIDPRQPRVKNVKRLTAFRHYLNLEKTYQRLDRMLKAFQDCDFITTKDYLERQYGA